MLNIKLNLPSGNEHIENIAFIKALLIKVYIDNLKVSNDEKEQIYKETLKYLKEN